MNAPGLNPYEAPREEGQPVKAVRLWRDILQVLVTIACGTLGAIAGLVAVGFINSHFRDFRQDDVGDLTTLLGLLGGLTLGGVCAGIASYFIVGRMLKI